MGIPVNQILSDRYAHATASHERRGASAARVCATLQTSLCELRRR